MHQIHSKSFLCGDIVAEHGDLGSLSLPNDPKQPGRS